MSTKVREIRADQFEAEVLGAGRPVALDFYSTECAPCEALAAKYDGLAEIYGDDVIFLKIYRQESRKLAESLGVTSSPAVLFFDRGERIGEVLRGGIRRADVQANVEALLSPERAKELRDRIPKIETECDVLIVGAGPAGLTAGIYAAQAKLKTIVIDRALAGGNLNVTHQVSNFPGFPKPQPGYMLAHLMLEHAKAAGVELRLAVDVSDVDLESKTALVDGVEKIHASKVVLATGSSPRAIGVKGEAEHKGRGISYCSTCDAKYYEGKHVVVIGGGNSAIEESLFIAKFAAKITVVHQFAKLQANKSAQEKAFAEPKISFVFEHEPREFVGTESSVNRVIVEDLRTHERKAIDCDGVFIFAGMAPNLDLVDGAVTRDRFGYLQVDEEMRTSVPGVFAAGDVRSKPYRQMTTAVSDGTIAAMALARELAA